MRLIIVESPTKAKTITKFLGKGYTVTSSYGHIRDLPEKKMGIDIKNGFTPEYSIPEKAAARVDKLRQLTRKSDEVILATDEDREGEAIAWHLSEILGLGNSRSSKSNSKTKKKSEFRTSRIVFHEITKSAIEKALANPRSIDMNLVDAQQARRVLDRLVGYELSPFLWKKIRRGLSAGRVQSVALRFIAEREREIEKFKQENFWIIDITIKKPGDSKKKSFGASLTHHNGEKIEQTSVSNLFAGVYKTKRTILSDKKSADKIAADLDDSVFKVGKIQRKKITRNPLPPFTTSTLQQSAINALGFSAKQTMSIAQKLYEEGYITYMRTDSTNLSVESMISARKTIAKLFGAAYALENPRYFTKKTKGAQEAHEAIRPTDVSKIPDELGKKIDPRAHRLYRLIWRRTIASQMQAAILDSVSVEITAKAKSSDNEYTFKSGGSTINFDGYLKVFEKSDAEKEKILPEMDEGEELELIGVDAQEKETAAPPRYNEASLVKALEEHGIGRPSTYAPTIATIMERKYVDKNEQKKLYPLEIGFLVNDVLVKHFKDIVDISFTAKMEDDLDEVAEGKKEWVPLIEEFYRPFHENLKKKTEKVNKNDLMEKTGTKCPECGGDLIVKFGRFGKFIACSNYPECKHTDKTPEEKKFEKENSGEICQICGAPMVVKYGKFGSFLGCSRYPECKGILKIEKKLGITCPKCGKGEIVERKSKKGRLFFGCNSYPKCDFAVWNKPTGEPCPRCGSLLVFATKGKVRCSKKECGFEK